MQDCCSFTCCSLEQLAHRRKLASLSLFCSYLFGGCSSELAQLVPLPQSLDSYIRYSNRLHDFPVTIPRCYSFSSFSFITARVGNSLPAECFPLTYALNFFYAQSHQTSLFGLFIKSFPISFSSSPSSFSCNSMPCSGCSALHEVKLD